ncbi:Uncharacterized protein FKW44_019992 [Caligus rogercresseyi]|uniref:C2H2-type domain-containing protein n=1 Tax=Caligus rogercresseyi TaxID=217165 RepID=A0A7T8GWM4_CALRO|nr:Uncharacterized protein FKW44_019992 [Caligus rogercresseyi]
MGELFRCEECSYETSFKATYVDHVAQHAEAPGKDKMKCSKCIKEFKSKIGLKLHLKQHYNDQLNLCLFCDFKTPLKII